jgi:hypothetical protein
MINGSEVIYAQDMPWYRLGKRLIEAHTAEEAVHAAGLGWRVAKTSVSPGAKPGSALLVREDLWDGKGEGILGKLRALHTPFQNVEAFSFLDPLVRSGAMEYDSAGAWAQGEWVWIMLRLGGEIEVAPKDQLAQFLLFGHTHSTGYHRLTYLLVRLASRSTLIESPFHNPKPLITVPNVRPRRFRASTEVALEEIRNHFERFASKLRAMLRVELNSDGADHYSLSVYEALRHERKKGGPTIEEMRGDCMACSRLFQDGGGNDLPGVKGTLWAAYAAVAEYFDHYKTVAEDWKYLRDIWFSPLKASALRVASRFVPTEE